LADIGENEMLKPLSAIPQFPNMLSSAIREEGESPRKQFIAVFEYPECQREFDGKNWKVTKDYRKQLEKNLFSVYPAPEWN
jgi:hypothetical protein